MSQAKKVYLACFLSVLGASLAIQFGSHAGVLVLPVELAAFLGVALKAGLVAATVWYGLRVGLHPAWAWVLGFSTLVPYMPWISLAILLSRNAGFQSSWIRGRPVVGREVVNDDHRIRDLVRWFMQRDPIVKVMRNRSVNILFDAGYRPYPSATVPQDLMSADLPSWFVGQVVADVQNVKDSSRREFVRYLDELGDIAHSALVKAGEIALECRLKMDNFVYEQEIVKIASGPLRESFKNSLLTDSVTSARLRVLAWLYHAWFGEWYKPPADRAT